MSASSPGRVFGELAGVGAPKSNPAGLAIDGGVDRPQSLSVVGPLREVAPGVWSQDADFRLPGGVPMPARATFLRVDDGGLLVHSPLGIDDETARHIAALGEVRYIVAPNCMHWLFVKAARDCYPGARVLGAPGLEKKLRGVPFEPLPESGRIPGAVGVRVQRVQGAPIMSEHVFFHENSRSLIVTDLIFNIHATRSLVMKMYLRLGGAYRRTAQSRVWRFLVRDRASAAGAARILLGWDFARVVVAHGEVVVDGARERAVEALRWMTAGLPPLLPAGRADPN